jgi:hypothetical protein
MKNLEGMELFEELRSGDFVRVDGSLFVFRHVFNNEDEQSALLESFEDSHEMFVSFEDGLFVEASSGEDVEVRF